MHVQISVSVSMSVSVSKSCFSMSPLLGLLLIAIEHCIIVIDEIEHLSQKFGVTTTLPDVVHHTLLWNNARPQEWNYVGSLLWHNRQKLATDLPSLHSLHLDQKIGLLLTVDGDLHVYLDGQHIKRVASGLPVSGKLWGAVDVSGSCSKVKSELLSGKLDAVCMYTL